MLYRWWDWSGVRLRHANVTWAGHLTRRATCRKALSRIHFGHSSDSPTPQSRVLIAVSPTVDRSLYKAPLASQTWVQFCQCPANRVTIVLVLQSIAFVSILIATCSRVDTIVTPELACEIVRIDRLHVTPDRIFHLNTISRILKSYPLNPIVVLTNDQGRGCRYWARCCVGVWSLTVGQPIRRGACRCILTRR